MRLIWRLEANETGRPASILRILSLDLLIYALQMTALTISYVNNRGNPTPVPEFPYEDPLLPGREMAEEVESDLEAGLRRRRKGADYDLDPLDEESWLDQQEAELDSGAAGGYGCGLYLVDVTDA